MENKKWTYAFNTRALADTGDYETIILFTNSFDTFQTNGEEMEEEELKLFCLLLNKMPDLFSHRLEFAKFEISNLKNEEIIIQKSMEKKLKEIKLNRLLGGSIEKVSEMKKEQEIKTEIDNLLNDILGGIKSL